MKTETVSEVQANNSKTVFTFLAYWVDKDNYNNTKYIPWGIIIINNDNVDRFNSMCYQLIASIEEMRFKSGTWAKHLSYLIDEYPEYEIMLKGLCAYKNSLKWIPVLTILKSSNIESVSTGGASKVFTPIIS